MTNSKIIKNISGSQIQILNRLVDNNDQYNVPQNLWLELAENTIIQTLVSSGDFIVNNGEKDLSVQAGLLHLRDELLSVHEPVQYISIIGENAPAAVYLGGAAYGYSLNIGEEIYTFNHLDNLINSEPITIQLHLAIDNTEADKWIQFEYTILTTTGIADKQMNTVDAIINTDQKEIPIVSNLIFDLKKELPSIYFENEEDNLFIKIKRINPFGKSSPTNNPAIIRIDKIYNKRKIS